MFKCILFSLLLFGAIVTFFPGSASAVVAAPGENGDSFDSTAEDPPAGFITTEPPARSNFSSATSVLLIVAGFWVLFVLMKDWLRLGIRFSNRFARFALSPRPALATLAVVFIAAIIGSWLIPPTAVSAQPKSPAKQARNPDFSSAVQFGGEGTTQVGRPVFDRQGNQYIYGAFNGALTIGGTTLEASKDLDMFVAKLGGKGNLIWLRHGSSAAKGIPNEMAIEAANSLAVDAAGNVYVGGGFVKQITLQGGRNQPITLRDAGGKNFNYEPYLAKYSAVGDLLWAKGGQSASPQDTDNLETGLNGINHVVFDSAGNPYVAGLLSGNNFLGAPAKLQGGTDIVLAKINPTTGAVVWMKVIGGPNDDAGSSLGIDGRNNLYLLGNFASKSISIPGAATFKNPEGNVDTFVAKFDSTGKNLWAEQLSNKGGVMGNQLVVNSAGEMFVSGQFIGSLRIDMAEDAVLQETESGEGEGDADCGGFVAKLDQDGEWVWANSFGGVGDGIALDGKGRVFVIGIIYGSGDLDGESGTEANFNSEGAADQFVAVFDADGEFEWATAIPGSGVESENIFGTEELGADYKPLGAAFNPATQSIFITGDFSGEIDFDKTKLKTEEGDRHAFLAEVSKGK